MTFEEMKAQYCGKNIRKKPKHEEDDLNDLIGGLED